jgi:hypothetical protein
MSLSELDRFILAHDPILYLRPTGDGSTLEELAHGQVITPVNAPTGVMTSHEFSRGANGTPAMRFNGTTQAVSISALTRFLTRLNGRPMTIGVRYKTTQAGHGTIFTANKADGAQGFGIQHNTLFGGSTDGNRLTLGFGGTGSGYRVARGYHGGQANDGTMHSHLFTIDPAIVPSSATVWDLATSPFAYFLDGEQVLTNNTIDWDQLAAYNPTAEAANASLGAGLTNLSFSDYLAADIELLFILPTNWSPRQVFWYERLFRGLDKPVLFADRVANVWPAPGSGGSMSVALEGDSQTTFASSGTGDQLSAWGDIRGCHGGIRRLGLPFAATRLGCAIDPGNGIANAADGVYHHPAAAFNSAVPAELTAAWPTNGASVMLPFNITYKTSGAVAASGGASVAHLTQDFPLGKIDEGMEWRCLIAFPKAAPGSITLEIVNGTSGAVIATATFNASYPNLPEGATLAFTTASYAAVWVSILLPAGSTIPTQINATTPTLTLRASGTGPIGFIASRLIKGTAGTATGIAVSVLMAQGGTTMKDHVAVLYDTLSLTQICNLIAADCEWHTRNGQPAKMDFCINLGTNDINDTSASRSTDGTVNGANPAGNTPDGAYNNFGAIVNRLTAAWVACGFSASNLSFTARGTQSWGSTSREFQVGAGVAAWIRDNPSVHACYIVGDIISPYELCNLQGRYMVAESDFPPGPLGQSRPRRRQVELHRTRRHRRPLGLRRRRGQDHGHRALVQAGGGAGGLASSSSSLRAAKHAARSKERSVCRQISSDPPRR